MTGKAFLSVGNLTFAWVGSGKLRRKCQVSIFDSSPIYKKDDKCSKENYRPITVLPCVDKVFEQLICMQLSTAFQRPLMWNKFQNDLSFFAKSSLSTYADDHQMFHVENDQSSVT